MSNVTVIVNARLLTLAAEQGDSQEDTGARRGKRLLDLGRIEDGWIRVEDDLIAGVGSGPYPFGVDGDDDEDLIEGGNLIDAGGSIVLPAFVDCHTHACWAGSRLDEYEKQIRGVPYLDILKEGGGIMSTVRAVRAASDEDLEERVARNVARMQSLGTGAIEIKSGYGLETEAELRMLRAIHSVAQLSDATIVGTFLGAHAIDHDRPHFVDETISETLPAITQEFPGITVDAYCEDGAWSVRDCERYFEAAIAAGCPIRVHADQFNPLGMVQRAIELGAVSVDHLEASNETGLEQLAGSSTFGVALPISGFHLNDGFMRGRFFVDAGGALAIATNYNPGSAPSPSMPFAIALACRKLGLTPAEAITCATWNAACVLGMQSRVGSLEKGKRANIQMLDCEDERELGWEIGAAAPLLVMIGGRIVSSRGFEADPFGDDDWDEVELEFGDDGEDDDDGSGDDDDVNAGDGQD